MATIEVLATLVIVFLGLLVYKLLIRSRWFTRFVSDIIEPPPASGQEVVARLRADQIDARQAASAADLQAVEIAQTAEALRSEITKPRKPRVARKKSEER